MNLPLEYHRVDSPAPSPGLTGNVSQGGLLFYSSEKMEVGQQLGLKLFFPLGSELTSIEALAKLVRVDASADEKWGRYSCGVKFLQLNHEDETKLAEFSKTISP